MSSLTSGAKIVLECLQREKVRLFSDTPAASRFLFMTRCTIRRSSTNAGPARAG